MRKRNAGSAYLLALMVLVILTIIGLSLTFATQTELMIGSNERVTQRAFYAAQSALGLAGARTLADHDKRSYFTEIEDIPANNPVTGSYSTGWLLKSRLEIGQVNPIAAPFCNLCDATGEFKYGSVEDPRYKVFHRIIVRGRLVGANGETVAQKVISDILTVDPWGDILPPEFEATMITEIADPERAAY